MEFAAILLYETQDMVFTGTNLQKPVLRIPLQCLGSGGLLLQDFDTGSDDLQALVSVPLHQVPHLPQAHAEIET